MFRLTEDRIKTLDSLAKEVLQENEEDLAEAVKRHNDLENAIKQALERQVLLSFPLFLFTFNHKICALHNCTHIHMYIHSVSK